MLRHTSNTNNSGIRFYKQIYDAQNCTKIAKMLYAQNCHQNLIKNARATKFIFTVSLLHFRKTHLQSFTLL